jgi:uncharacterized protein YcbK (DUF882 family)
MIMSLFQKHLETSNSKVNRRNFLKLGLISTAATFSTNPAFAAFHKILSPERSLSFFNTHTEERLTVVYWSQGRYSSAALDDINHIMRDHRTGGIKPIDTHLLDLLCTIHTTLQASSPFHIISGYRSPATNAMLHERSRGVASKSLHLKGKAADIRLPGYDLSLLRRTAVAMKVGGVGYYPRSDFVHVDVGRVRYW